MVISISMFNWYSLNVIKTIPLQLDITTWLLIRISEWQGCNFKLNTLYYWVEKHPQSQNRPQQESACLKSAIKTLE